MARILIIDDDPQVCETLQSLNFRLGHECLAAHTLKDGLEQLGRMEFDLVFLDVRLPDGNGLQALGQIRNQTSPPDVIVLTGQGDPEGAELAIQGGVWDYLVKPSPIKQIKETLNRALAYRREKKASGQTMTLDLKDVVGESSVMRRCYERIAQAGGSDSTVLLTGETGTGKELLARSIHRNSLRSSRAFVVVDCASLTESLLESILFGHTKGSFTGAARDRVGLVKIADQGTLFLDEIGELPLSAQKTFLRVLQERRFRPVGSNQELESDFRLISATNRDLAAMVKSGEFRQDLYYRINTIQLHLPALREREDDVLILARYHIDKLCRQRNIPIKEMDPDLEGMLRRYEWPGNVRELFNTIEQAFVHSGAEKTVYAQHLPQAVRIRVARTILGQGREEAGPEEAQMEVEEALPTLKDFKTSKEREYLLRLVGSHGKDIQKMLSVSGLSRSHLYAMLKKHDIEA
ncbi:MAG: sigma-54 dependent transcriptional regulator [Desulfomicrobium sp.]|nr:sigma-54 dependent transcriptional regulator [Pseudomonadota bacterium]MBV1710522.1 sigma-54 dependent transcriptional regulator [Desulfomicrobium sp.]MBU4570130.1 sigma-54 dependent transcriptional regulator [Pseudomonadota bacterium]MBU4593050.1 sigma-54 dependent transcriptional regulator [Pseudomonadota bacterium]MBV1718859.1 sigma-54 dependent transcriptional regulator [Desulfomicrobium sp.]